MFMFVEAKINLHCLSSKFTYLIWANKTLHKKACRKLQWDENWNNAWLFIRKCICSLKKNVTDFWHTKCGKLRMNNFSISNIVSKNVSDRCGFIVAATLSLTDLAMVAAPPNFSTKMRNFFYIRLHRQHFRVLAGKPYCVLDHVHSDQSHSKQSLHCWVLAQFPSLPRENHMLVLEQRAPLQQLRPQMTKWP